MQYASGLKKIIGGIFFPFFSCIMSGVGLILILMLEPHYIVTTVILSFVSVGFGNNLVQLAPLLIEQHGTDELSAAWGLTRMAESAGFILIPPLSGESIL